MLLKLYAIPELREREISLVGLHDSANFKVTYRVGPFTPTTPCYTEHSDIDADPLYLRSFVTLSANPISQTDMTVILRHFTSTMSADSLGNPSNILTGMNY